MRLEVENSCCPARSCNHVLQSWLFTVTNARASADWRTDDAKERAAITEHSHTARTLFALRPLTLVFFRHLFLKQAVH